MATENKNLEPSFTWRLHSDAVTIPFFGYPDPLPINPVLERLYRRIHWSRGFILGNAVEIRVPAVITFYSYPLPFLGIWITNQME